MQTFIVNIPQHCFTPQPRCHNSTMPNFYPFSNIDEGDDFSNARILQGSETMESIEWTTDLLISDITDMPLRLRCLASFLDGLHFLII